MDAVTVAIHQPNLMPWLGYFNKIARADFFVLLDDVQIQKTGASYTNRVDIGMGGRAHPITAPIARRSGTWTILDTEFADQRWKDQAIKTLRGAYAKAPAFKEHADWLFDLVAYPSRLLADYNIHFIQAVANALGLSARLLRSSEMDVRADDQTDRLIELTRSLGGNVYLSGKGGATYQIEPRFEAAGIALRYIDNSGLSYPQARRPEPLKGLSIVDALFHVGVPATAELLLRAGAKAND